jgi:hypothetical protein
VEREARQAAEASKMREARAADAVTLKAQEKAYIRATNRNIISALAFLYRLAQIESSHLWKGHHLKASVLTGRRSQIPQPDRAAARSVMPWSAVSQHTRKERR